MPIYEYECPTHGRYEVSQRITEAALTSCVQPECAQPIRKLISSSAFALKGGGWYSDGYASTGGGKKEAKSEAAGCGAGACGTGTGGCAKAEA